MKCFMLVAVLGLVFSQVLGKATLSKDEFKMLEKLLLNKRQGGDGPGPESPESGSGPESGFEPPSGSGFRRDELKSGEKGFGHEAIGFLDFLGKHIETNPQCLERLGLPPPPESSERRAAAVKKSEVMQVLGKVAGALKNMGDKFENALGDADAVKALFEDMENGVPVDPEDINKAHGKMMKTVYDIHVNEGADANCAMEVLFPLSFRLQLFHAEGFTEDFKCRRTYEALLWLIISEAKPKPGVFNPKSLEDVTLPTNQELRDRVEDDNDFWGYISHAMRADLRCLAKMHMELRDGIEEHEGSDIDNPGTAVEVIDYLLYFLMQSSIDRELLVASVGHLLDLVPAQHAPNFEPEARSYATKRVLKDVAKIMASGR